MRFLNFLWKNKRKAGKHRKRILKPSAADILKSDIESVKIKFSEFNTILTKHESRLADQSMLIEEHAKRLGSLESIIISRPIRPVPADFSRPDRSIESTRPDHLDVQTGKFDISMFSPQEKRVLAVFFENRDLNLSYADIGKSLGKSANTIKNQMHQINIKADLFNHIVDNQSRKRFKLKDNIMVEKYLKVK